MIQRFIFKKKDNIPDVFHVYLAAKIHDDTLLFLFIKN